MKPAKFIVWNKTMDRVLIERILKLSSHYFVKRSFKFTLYFLVGDDVLKIKFSVFSSQAETVKDKDELKCMLMFCVCGTLDSECNFCNSPDFLQFFRRKQYVFF